MNKGLEILLKRVDSNPEEFSEWGGRWSALLEAYTRHLPEDELKMLKDKLNERYCREFSEKVMQELLNPKNPNPNEVGSMRSGGLTQGLLAQQSQAQMQLQQIHLARQQAITDAQRYGSQGLLSSLGSLFK